MEQCYGIVYTDEGRYVMAVMRPGRNNTWTCVGTSQWQSNNIFRRILLFHHGIYFGIASWWRPQEHDVPGDTMVAAGYDSPSLPSSGYNRFEPVAHTADITIHEEELQANLLAVVPEDIVLATLPLYLGEDSGDSFVTIYGNEEYYIIGVTVQRSLTAVFHMVPGSPEKLAGYIARVQRYWDIRCKSTPFPDTIVTVGETEYTPDSAFEKPPLRVAEAENEIARLRAMGTALAQNEETVPLFSGQTPEASFRKARSWLYGISAGLVVTGLIAAALYSGLNFWFHKKKLAYEKEYQHIIGYNKEIKKLTDRNNEIAETILRLENTFSRRTLWGKFLHGIGKNRPEDLYFERFGSEPIKGNSQAIKIAIMGWTPKELSVTTFIATLQKMPYVTQITLSSMERNKKKRSIYGFKIICTLLLNEQ